MEYHAYLIGKDGHITARQEFEAATDQEALAKVSNRIESQPPYRVEG